MSRSDVFDGRYRRQQLHVNGRHAGTVFRPLTRSGQRKGLLGRDRLPAGVGLLLSDGLVHMIGMRFSLDLVFISRRGVVVSVHRNVSPGLRLRGHWRARRTLEMAAGQADAAGIRVGDRLTFS